MARRRKKSSLSRKIFWIVVILLALNPIRTWYTQEQERRELEELHHHAQKQVESLEEEIEALRYTLEHITEDEYIEAMARQNLRMVREDEWVLVDIQQRENQ
ncbi:septum formation initiator family protein [Tindallia californiensis]|uniref:Septum formation initiator n=1 Tax=Tindallia californiensis TaxID=159292 RepID=A0A1H3PFU7_9FIRM|nr:septum formation initiator family protein [Tindallia californiensis]SDY99960.1 Septum formation initiator [Tindallia californiensis]